MEGEHAGHGNHMHHPTTTGSPPLTTVMGAVLTSVAMHNANHSMPKHDDHNDHSGHGMSMVFHFGVQEMILFQQWAVSSPGGMVASVIGVFIMAVLYEGLKYFREHLFKLHFSSIQYASVAVTGQDGRTVTEVHKIVRNHMLSWPHITQTCLHVIQIVLSYFLMLIFMTYNVWLCLGVALGAGFGYFIFGWKKATVVDVTDHCH